MATVLPSINTVLPNFTAPAAQPPRQLQNNTNIPQEVFDQEIKNNLMLVLQNLIASESSSSRELHLNYIFSLLQNGGRSGQESFFEQLNDFLTSVQNGTLFNQKTMVNLGLANGAFPPLQNGGNLNKEMRFEQQFASQCSQETMANFEPQNVLGLIPHDRNSSEETNFNDQQCAVFSSLQNTSNCSQDFIANFANDEVLSLQYNTGLNSIDNEHQQLDQYLEKIPYSKDNTTNIGQESNIPDDTAIVNMVNEMEDAFQTLRDNSEIALQLDNTELLNTEAEFSEVGCVFKEKCLEKDGDVFAMDTPQTWPGRPDDEVGHDQGDEDDVQLCELRSWPSYSSLSSGYSSDATLNQEVLELSTSDAIDSTGKFTKKKYVVCKNVKHICAKKTE